MSTASMENFERFLNREPLTPELAAIRKGAEEQTLPIYQLPAPLPARERLQREEMASLNELRHGELWAPLEAMAAIVVQKYVHAATMLSQEDPLRNRDQVAEAWACAKIAREFWRVMTVEIDRAAAKVRGEVQDEVILDAHKAER